jgi:hypothetical protein
MNFDLQEKITMSLSNLNLEEFIDLMLERQHYDPLAVLWFALSRHIPNTRYEELSARRMYLFDCNAYEIERVLCGWGICAKSPHPHSASWHQAIAKVESGLKLGMYRLENTLKTYIRDMKWCRETCLRVCMYMRMVCGRDVAGLIGRALLQLYEDDFKWMLTKPDEKQVRERICKWLPRETVCLEVI